MEPSQQSIIKAQLSSLKSKGSSRRSFGQTKASEPEDCCQPETTEIPISRALENKPLPDLTPGDVVVGDFRDNGDKMLVEIPPAPMQDDRPATIIKWTCTECSNECIPVMRESRCLCGHRMKEHKSNPKNNLMFPCASKSCKCTHFFFLVAEGSWILRCRCKHKHTDHDAGPGPHKCTKCPACTGFDSPWVCNCGHTWASHAQQSIVVTKDKVIDEAGQVARFEKKQHFYRQDGLDGV